MRGSRRWAVAAAVAVPLLAGGCGSGDDGSDGAESPSASKSADKDASGGPGGGKDSDGPDDGGTQGASSGGNGGGSSSGGSGGSSGGGAGKDADVSPYQGTWSTKKAGSGDELLIMNIQQKSVSLIGDGVACQGSLKAADKPASIELTCKNDSKKYAAGSVAEVDGKQLSVEWSERTTRFTKGMEMTEAPG